MAHLENYKRGQTGMLLDHCGREPGDGKKRSNPRIDPKRTRENYVISVLPEQDGVSPQRTLRRAYRDGIRKAVEHTNEVRAKQGRKALYSSAAVLSSWCITLPPDCPPEHEQDFFIATTNFVVQRYKKKGAVCLGGFLHRDETTPHLHCPVIPTNAEGCLDRTHVCDRNDLKTFHDDLQEYLDETLGFHTTVLLDDEDVLAKAKSKLTREELTAVNDYISRSVASQTAYERKKLAKASDALEKRADDLKARENALEIREADLEGRISNFEVEVDEKAKRYLKKQRQEKLDRQSRKEQQVKDGSFKLSDWF